MLYLTHCVEKCCRLRYVFKSIHILRHSAVAVVQITVCDKIQHVRQLFKSPFATKSNMCDICPCESCKGCCDNPSLSKSAVCGVCLHSFCRLHCSRICQHLLFMRFTAFQIWRFCNMHSCQVFQNLAFTWFLQCPYFHKKSAILFQRHMKSLFFGGNWVAGFG